MAFAAVIEAREDAKSSLSTLREAMRERRERERRAAEEKRAEEERAARKAFAPGQAEAVTADR